MKIEGTPLEIAQLLDLIGADAQERAERYNAEEEGEETEYESMTEDPYIDFDRFFI